MKQLENIFTRLGLDRSNGLYITKDKLWEEETSFPNRVKALIKKKIEPDAFFCFDNKPLILFFLNPSEKHELHKKIWNFNECPIAIIIEKDLVEVFNGFNLYKNTKLLERIGGEEKLDDFNYFKLVTGETWEHYTDQLNYKNRVDYQLLENIRAVRKQLVEIHGLNSKITNAVIGKSIFVRYLIDRKVKLNFEENPHVWSNDEFCELLDHPQKVQKFFNYLEDKEKGFNGNLFPLTSGEYNQITNGEFAVIKRLLKGEDIDKGQFSFFQFYNFSIIPIEFISNVYELFIGQENQKKAGAYYTPLFLVDYILKETVEKKLNSEGSDYNCKVLDPACGSGIFLVETLRKIIEKYIYVTGINVKSDKFKTAIKKLAIENIYGIDKDTSAVQVAIFSIYLTLLDYLEPPEITNFKFPALLNTNFFIADFFDEDLLFNNTLKDIEFNYIVGNPPWKGNGMDAIGNKYLKNRREREKGLNKKFAIAINNNELAEGFVLRTSDFCSRNTEISLIIRSSSLYNLGYGNEESPFRQYWLEEFFVNRIFELASVRYEVFEKTKKKFEKPNKKAVAPAAILFYRYANGEVTDNNRVEHITLKQNRFFSLFKIFTINRADFKLVQQKRLKDFDWLFKVLVYGSYLDFNFLKRLKEEFHTVNKIISDENRFVVSTGLHSRTEPIKKPKDTKLIENLPFLKTNAVNSFFIDYKNTTVLEKNKIDLVKDIRIYHHPMLLIRKGLDMKYLTAKCAIGRKNVLFKDGITSIKIIKNVDEKILMDIASVYSTSLFTYYAINTFASIGIEREQTQNYDKFSLPYLNIKAKSSFVNIEHAYKIINLEKKKTLINDININEQEIFIRNELDRINKIIYEKIGINDIESTLIDYSLEVNRNLIIGDERQKSIVFSNLDFQDETLKNYADLFIKRFKSKLDTKQKKFVVEIWHTNQIVGMFFKMISSKEYKQNINWENKQNNAAFLTFLLNIGTEKITDKLFVQKDIRGFDKNGEDFFIIKPNEKRLWHKAIGYLDVNEFADAILKSRGKAN